MDNYRIGNCCDIGKVRKSNQDNMCTFECGMGRVVVVCDGMGGMKGGEVASQIATDVIKDILQGNSFADPNEAIVKSMVAANQAVMHRGEVEPEVKGMGTTCVMAIIKDGMVYYGGVGDSRIYYIRKSGMVQLTKDQSYVQMLVDVGEITPEQALVHPRKNMITNAMGLVDMAPPVPGEPFVPEVGSYLLLCTDGLTNMLSDKEICAIVCDGDDDFGAKVQRLVDRANEAGGNDNITVQLVDFMAPYGEVPPAPKRKLEVAVDVAGDGDGKKASLVPTIIVCVIVLALSAVALWFYSSYMSDGGGEEVGAVSAVVDEPKVEESEAAGEDVVDEAPVESEEKVADESATPNKVVAEAFKKAAEPAKVGTDAAPVAKTEVQVAKPAETKAEPAAEKSSAKAEESEAAFDPSSLDEGL